MSLRLSSATALSWWSLTDPHSGDIGNGSSTITKEEICCGPVLVQPLLADMGLPSSVQKYAGQGLRTRPFPQQGGGRDAYHAHFPPLHFPPDVFLIFKIRRPLLPLGGRGGHPALLLPPGGGGDPCGSRERQVFCC